MGNFDPSSTPQHSPQYAMPLEHNGYAYPLAPNGASYSVASDPIPKPYFQQRRQASVGQMDRTTIDTGEDHVEQWCWGRALHRCHLSSWIGILAVALLVGMAVGTGICAVLMLVTQHPKQLVSDEM